MTDIHLFDGKSSHQNVVAVYDGVEAVGDGENGALPELVSYRLLDQLVCSTDTDRQAVQERHNQDKETQSRFH
jgi:hypothetical protein